MLAVVLRSRHESGEWTERGMTHQVNDRWTASFTAAQPGWYEYTVQAWIDWFGTLRRDLGKKADAGQDVGSELLELADAIRRTARRVGGPDGDWLRGQAEQLDRGRGDQAARVAAALDPALLAV